MTPRERIERIEAECSGVWAESGVSDWDRRFLEGIKAWNRVTDKQEPILARIERRVFGEGEE